MKNIFIVMLPLTLLFAVSCKKAEEPIQHAHEHETITIKVNHDTTICWYENQTYILDASTGNPNSVYYWQNPINGNNWGSPFIKIDEPGHYLLYIYTDTLCQHFEITINFCEAVIYFPNSFSPNGDGVDNFWAPKGANISDDDFSLNITDSHDNLLYHADKLYGAGWNGKIGGEYCPAGFYYYDVKYKSLDGVEYHRAGMFQLIR